MVERTDCARSAGVAPDGERGLGEQIRSVPVAQRRPHRGLVDRRGGHRHRSVAALGQHGGELGAERAARPVSTMWHCVTPSPRSTSSSGTCWAPSEALKASAPGYSGSIGRYRKRGLATPLSASPAAPSSPWTAASSLSVRALRQITAVPPSVMPRACSIHGTSMGSSAIGLSSSDVATIMKPTGSSRLRTTHTWSGASSKKRRWTATRCSGRAAPTGRRWPRGPPRGSRSTTKRPVGSQPTPQRIAGLRSITERSRERLAPAASAWPCA